MPFAAYKRLSWQDGGLKRGPLAEKLEDVLESEEASDSNFAGVAEGENEFELPEILTPEEFKEVPLVPLALTPSTDGKQPGGKR